MTHFYDSFLDLHHTLDSQQGKKFQIRADPMMYWQQQSCHQFPMLTRHPPVLRLVVPRLYSAQKIQIFESAILLSLSLLLATWSNQLELKFHLGPTLKDFLEQ